MSQEKDKTFLHVSCQYLVYKKKQFVNNKTSTQRSWIKAINILASEMEEIRIIDYLKKLKFIIIIMVIWLLYLLLFLHTLDSISWYWIEC